MRTLAILTNGGDTCALNASIRSIRDSAYQAGYKKIYGIRRGYQGLVDGWIEDITHKEIDARIGGSCLGSLRVSPSDRVERGGKPSYGPNPERCFRMSQCLSDYRIDVLVVIGGDGTLQATRMFQDWVHEQRASRRLRPFEIIGFLKTIDNDIRTFTNFEGVEVSLCPGFPSAVKKIVSCVQDLRVTARTAERAFSVETMGRDAGWLAASATFGGAEILLVPEHLAIWTALREKETPLSSSEVPVEILHTLVESIADFYTKNRNVLIAVAEGFEPGVPFLGVEEFTRVIHDLYGTRKKVGATELVALLVSPVLEYYFECLSSFCVQAHRQPGSSVAIEGALKEARMSPAGKKYESKVGDPARKHPLKEWDVEEQLRAVLDVQRGETQPRAETLPDSLTGSPGTDDGHRRSPLAVPPYQFEIRPHRTDYLPRSGPPSSYDYRLATVLGQKVGLMLLDKEFGAVPALEQVVLYEDLTLRVIKTVRIEEIRTLSFDSVDYFDREFPLQVSERITDFFRTILSGPEDLEKAIQERQTAT